MPTIRHKTLAQLAEDAIYDKIFNHELEPGCKIPLAKTAEELGMSEIPLREALSSLAAKGLVTAVSQKGYQVSILDYESALEKYHVRLLLEPEATALAAKNITDRELQELEKRADAIQFHRVSSEGISNNRDFHYAIYKASRSQSLMDAIIPLFDSCEFFRQISLNERINHERAVDDHKRIVGALMAHDSELARKMMYEHLNSTIKTIKLMQEAEHIDKAKCKF